MSVDLLVLIIVGIIVMVADEKVKGSNIFDVEE